MRTGRPDLDITLASGVIPDDEPVFTLRGRDPYAADAVRAWAAIAFAAGAPVAVVESALQQADEIAAWAVKVAPDGSRFTPDRAAQLTYQFERRAWRDAHPRAPRIDAALAEHFEAAAAARESDRLAREAAHAAELQGETLEAVPTFATSGYAQVVR